jgi:molybdopterin synthase catalytic subunit/molybdopterin converting factor small subunit
MSEGYPAGAARRVVVTYAALMLVRVRLFAQLRERAGRSAIELELPEGARVSDALAAVGDLAAGIPLVMAVNREYASAGDLLHASDELALVPPVSGGSGGADGSIEPSALHWAIVDHELSLDALAARVRDPRAGAVVTFSGATRDVDFLDYEAYAEMALVELERIVRAAAARHGLTAAAAEHRIGRVGLGEASVIVAASAPHRPEAFLGARELIDEIKAQLPIWKREEGEFVPGSVPRHRADPPG